MNARVEAFHSAWFVALEDFMVQGPSVPRPIEAQLEDVIMAETLAETHARAWEAIAVLARSVSQDEAARFRRVFQRVYGKARRA